MLYLALSVLLSVVLLLNFRLFPRFGVNTVQAIVLNYPVCFLTGLLLLPRGQAGLPVGFTLDFGLPWTWPALALGLGFIVTFLLSGASTQRSGITATSLANNLSLVIPVGFSLFVFGTAPAFDGWNYLGLGLALVAVGLSTWKGGEREEREKGDEGEEGDERKKSGGRVGWGALLPLAVFIMYGLTNTTISYINLHYITAPGQVVGVTLVMVLGAVVSGLVLLAFRLARGQERIEGRNLIAAVTLGVPNFLSFYTLQLGLSALGNNGALVYPLYNIGVILVAALMAYLFFGEKLLILNRVGLGLAVLAIALISWQSLARLLP